MSGGSVACVRYGDGIGLFVVLLATVTFWRVPLFTRMAPRRAEYTVVYIRYILREHALALVLHALLHSFSQLQLNPSSQKAM